MYEGVENRNPAVRGSAGSAGLYEVLDLILDKGIVVDAYVRVSLVGIEVLTIDARVVIASVDTYLRWAEACERLVLHSEPKDLSDLMSGGAVQAGRKAKEKARDISSRLKGEADEGEEQEKEKSGSRRGRK